MMTSSDLACGRKHRRIAVRAPAPQAIASGELRSDRSIPWLKMHHQFAIASWKRMGRCSAIRQAVYARRARRPPPSRAAYLAIVGGGDVRMQRWSVMVRRAPVGQGWPGTTVLVCTVAASRLISGAQL